MNKKIKKIYSDITARIKSSEKILIASHRDPDGDSIGSQLALAGYVKSLGKTPHIFSHGELPYKYRFLPNIEIMHPIDQGIEFKSDLAIILDCSELDRIGGVQRLITNKTDIINIDHHPDNQGFGRINLMIPEASSVGEMITEFFVDREWQFGTDTATQLYTAIMTDTGRFRFDSTNRRTMELAGLLLEKGISTREITDKVYFSMPPEILKMTGTLLSQMQFFHSGRVCIMGIDKDTAARHKTTIGDMEGLAEYTLYGRNTEIGCLLKEQNDNSTKVSLRSRNTNVDVSRVAKKYGGGGHINASGCLIELPIDAARTKLVTELKELLNGNV